MTQPPSEARAAPERVFPRVYLERDVRSIGEMREDGAASVALPSHVAALAIIWSVLATGCYSTCIPECVPGYVPSAGTCGCEVDPRIRQYVSGSRLRARVHDGGGDATILVAWHDTELDVDCSFERAGDDQTRCLPLGVDVGAESVFVDASCTTAAALVPEGAPDALWMRDGSPDPTACTYVRNIGMRRLGDVIAEPAAIFSRSATGACVRGGSVTSGRWMRASEPVDPGTFVRADLVDEPRSPRLGVRRVIADDGTRETNRIVVLATAVSCAPARVFGSVCLPEDIGWAPPGVFFGDASCRTPVAYDPRPESCVPGMITDAVVSCEAPTRFFAVGEPLDGFTNASCEPTSDYTFWALGPELTAEEAPRLGSAEIGDGRLHVRYWTDWGFLLPETFVDVALGGPCSVESACDGSRRCFASTAASISDRFFRDAECTVPIIIAPIPCDPTEEPPRVARVETPPACMADGAYHEVGEPIEPTAVFYRDEMTGTCEPTVFESYLAFAMGEALPVSAFSEVEERLE